MSARLRCCEGGTEAKSEQGEDASEKLHWRNRTRWWLLRSAITRRGHVHCTVQKRYDHMTKSAKNTRSSDEKQLHFPVKL